MPRKKVKKKTKTKAKAKKKPQFRYSAVEATLEHGAVLATLESAGFEGAEESAIAKSAVRRVRQKLNTPYILKKMQNLKWVARNYEDGVVTWRISNLGKRHLVRIREAVG